jgi:hypothetical protein
MRMKQDESAEFPGCSGGCGVRSCNLASRGRGQAKSGRCGRRTSGSFLRLRTSQAGFEVVVLEGQGRAGGRVQTLREGLDPEIRSFRPRPGRRAFRIRIG